MNDLRKISEKGKKKLLYRKRRRIDRIYNSITRKVKREAKKGYTEVEIAADWLFIPMSILEEVVEIIIKRLRENGYRVKTYVSFYVFTIYW